jgi:hypothetical protein
MNLRVIGAGLPRTGTASLAIALEYLLGGRCYHMREIPGHPFDLGDEWNRALSGNTPDWDRLFDGYIATVDWPASLFWRELSKLNPDVTVLLSTRDNAEIWWQSAEATILPVAREALAPGWSGGRGLLTLLERFTETDQWDDPAILMAAYDRHLRQVRESISPHRLVEWRPTDGWEPICHALNVPVPTLLFPQTNLRSEWN